MERMEIGGTGIDIWRRGTGETVLFLHPGEGFAADDAFLTGLAATYDTIAPWHPGFGHSDLPKGWNTVEDLACFYLDFIDALALEDVTLVGSSFGGWIAAEVAVRGSPRLSRLVLMDALGIRLGERTVRDIADFHNTDAALLEELTWADPAGRRRDISGLDDHALEGIIRSREAFALFGWRPYMHNPALARWLHRIAVPVLVLWGEADGIVKPDYGRAYAGLIGGNAGFAGIPDAGHYPHIERPRETLRLVRDFIEG